MDNLYEKLTMTNETITNILNEEVTIYYVSVANSEVLVNRDHVLPSYKTSKEYLSDEYVKSTGEYVLGTTMDIKEQLDYELYQDNSTRYYLVDIPDLLSLSDEYKYISVDNMSSKKERTVIVKFINPKQKNLV